MPLLIPAIGAVLMWFGRFLLSLFAGEAVRKILTFTTLGIIMAFVMETMGKNLFGFSIFDTGTQVEGALATVPAFGKFLLVEWGVLAAIYLVMTAHIAKWFYRRLFGAVGGR